MANKLKNRLGETNISTYGQKMKIIKYVNESDIDVEFDDGTIVEHKRYGNFKIGQIKNPNLKTNPQTKNRVGETNVSTCGQIMKIVKYKDAHDIDVEFEDGTVVKHKEYKQFKKGTIKNPNCGIYDIYLKRLGEITTSTCGQKMKIIRYNNKKDIDVEFEDGTIVEHRSYLNFKEGTIRNPNYNSINVKAKNTHEGETKINVDGLKMTILVYRRSKDCDVIFEDGTIVEHQSYAHFNSGRITNPEYRKKAAEIIKQEKVNETSTSSAGQKMKIIRYGGCDDIDIEFEDGTIVYKQKYSCFKKGLIRNPNYNPDNIRAKQKNEGSISINKNGLKMKLIKYHNAKNCDVLFEDGIIIENRVCHNFRVGQIKHPELSSRKKSVYKGIATKFAWRENDKVYYTCKCQKCGEENIWTPQQMIEHAKKCENKK